jgi:hypothetical protein
MQPTPVPGRPRRPDRLIYEITEGAALQIEARLRLLDLAENDAPALACAARVGWRGEPPGDAAAVRRTG